MSDEVKIEPEILNSGYSFVRMAPLEVRNKFAAMPAKTLLSEGETLYRFLGGELAAPFDFWLPLETYHHLRKRSEMPVWAVWNNPRGPATKFCRATLLKKVYGFRGCVRLDGKRAVTAADLVSQSMVWIPDLAREDFFLRAYPLGSPETGFNLPAGHAAHDSA